MASYLGSGKNLEDAVKAAHAQIPRKKGEAVVCRVLDWGYHTGGYVENPEFFALVCRQDNLPAAAG
jgi:hypothetical protein